MNTAQSRAFSALARLHSAAHRSLSGTEIFKRGGPAEGLDDDAARLVAFINGEPFNGIGDPPVNEDK